MKRFVSFGLLAALVLAGGFYVAPRAQDADQVILTTIKAGVQTQGSMVQQTGEVSTLSAAVASTTRTEVVAAPASGSIYLRGVLVETATTTTGKVTVTQGTGADCVTSPVVLFTLGIGTGTSPFPVGYYPIGIAVPAAKALCLTTDAATTSARVLAQ